MATSAGWDGTLNAIFDDTDCKLPDSEIGETGWYFDNQAKSPQFYHPFILSTQVTVESLLLVSPTW